VEDILYYLDMGFSTSVSLIGHIIGVHKEITVARDWFVAW
jgi:hypothetical protein